ncbi:MAG: UDP-3-O-[3-hydroxymyristoyl] N-acetylglucosamine deacetylase [Candidatus Saganbacteria bacterium]|nr:UDP-3-O-[3-hydroxymyristoyl] N-acetylglucosamine deacetylase [Candidatus Saganbacteria bacterium]
MKQRTIRGPVRLSGQGIHSGEPASLVIKPAAPDSGICFIHQGQRIPALVKSVTRTERGTVLGGLSVTEHFLAAAWALGLDNLEVEVDGPELPALDGSALPYVEALENIGLLDQPAEKDLLALDHPIDLTEGKASLSARPYNGLRVDFMVDFAGVGRQRLSFELQGSAFKRDIAPARTFGYVDELAELNIKGLARGATQENALALGRDGYVNEPRFPDEPVRHKVLDLLGDLALIGRPLKAHITAERSGHKLNIELARRLSGK